MAPRVTATSPVTTPARAASPGTPASAPSSATAATRSSAARTARSASPSAAAGVPHTAITASPMNFSTTPPYRPITVRARSKYCDSSSRTASGSRASDNGVDPTTSQNSTEHTRRSATGPAAGAKTPGPAATASAAPHSPQNFWPGEPAIPHERQTSASAVPHSPQNFWPDGLSAEHRGQIILGEGYRSQGAPEKARKATGSRRAQAAHKDCPGDRAAGQLPRPAQRPRRRARRFRAGPGAANRQPPQSASHNQVICAVRVSGPGHNHQAHSRRSAWSCQAWRPAIHHPL